MGVNSKYLSMGFIDFQKRKHVTPNLESWDAKNQKISNSKEKLDRTPNSPLPMVACARLDADDLV